MREDICTIPISDVFEPREGCPFCRMRDMLEDRMATYITGAAMMEPDVRIETNRLGFCKTHFDMVLERGTRLSVALILESLLAETQKDVLPGDGKVPVKKITAAADRREHSCFICENIEKNMSYLCSTVLKLWQSEPEFRELYASQSHICLPHYNRILKEAERLPKKIFPDFAAATRKLTLNYMEQTRADITHFCRMFDYRNAGGDWGTSKGSIQRAVEFLTSRPAPEGKTEGKNR